MLKSHERTGRPHGSEPFIEQLERLTSINGIKKTETRPQERQLGMVSPEL
jgi:hypothetical protein